MSQFILVFDHGTTSIRACVMNRAGEIIARGQQPFEQIYPRPGWVEHKPEVLWTTTLAVAEVALRDARIDWRQVAAIGLTNQRETVILWDKTTGRPVHNAIVWQCRRTTEYCQSLKDAGHEAMVREKTGLVLDPYFSASKIRWLFDNVPEVQALHAEGKLLAGTVDTWILWHLSGRKAHVTDFSNASRTMLFNIHTRQWDADLLQLFGVPAEILPAVHPSRHAFGETAPELTGGVAVPLASDIGDQQAALHGQKCWRAGQAKSTYGTGAFLVMNTGDQAVASHRGLLTTLACDALGQPAFALEGAIFIAGGAVEWLQKQMGFFSHPAEMDAMVEGLPGNQQVYFVPAFTGLGAPHWNANARGLITGLTQDTGKAHIVRAALEAMAYQTKEVLDAMILDSRESGEALNLSTLRVDGGVTRSEFLCRFLANMLNVPIVRTDDAELTAKGAGYLAGLAVGFWQSPDEIFNLPETTDSTTPSPGVDDGVRACLYAGWQSAVQKALLL